SEPYRGASPHPTPPPQAGEGAERGVAHNPPLLAGEGGARARRGRVGAEAREVLLLVDTFNRYFEPENARAAERVLTRAGYRVTTPEPIIGRPLCCGRTFLAAGMVDEARAEARRMLDALSLTVLAGVPIVGL